MSSTFLQYFSPNLSLIFHQYFSPIFVINISAIFLSAHCPGETLLMQELSLQRCRPTQVLWCSDHHGWSKNFFKGLFTFFLSLLRGLLIYRWIKIIKCNLMIGELLQFAAWRVSSNNCLLLILHTMWGFNLLFIFLFLQIAKYISPSDSSNNVRI